MLGISLDSKQSATNKCDNCETYCEHYQPLYDIIKSSLLHQCFLTFSPAPSSAAKYEFYKEDHTDDFIRFVKSYLLHANITNFIAVFELTLKGQPHYHVYLQFKNKVTFIKRVIQRLYHAGNVLPFYGPPSKGIHYLFKDSDNMAEYLGDTPVHVSTYGVNSLVEDSDETSS